MNGESGEPEASAAAAAGSAAEPAVGSPTEDDASLDDRA